MTQTRPVFATLIAAVALSGAPAFAQPGGEPKPATPTTVRANEAVAKAMTMNDKQDFEDATRGLMAELKDPLVKAADGRTVWNTQRYDFIKGDAPATRQPQPVAAADAQHRAGPVQGGRRHLPDPRLRPRQHHAGRRAPRGWIVIDTMLTDDVARAGLKLAMETLKSSKPVVAVIYTHSHADHFGGVRGVIDEADVRSGKVKVIAPEGFMDNAVAENVLAGNAMSRRANYMYGVSLPANDKGSVGTGLGLALSLGTPGLIPPKSSSRRPARR